MATTELIELAIETSKKAYVPLFSFSSRSCFSDKDGSTYTGVNIENASYPLTNCGERTAIFKSSFERPKRVFPDWLFMDKLKNQSRHVVLVARYGWIFWTRSKSDLSRKR